jgi:hypothetical protein
MVQRQVTVDEKWPFFELIEPKEGFEDYQYDIPDTMYSEYCYIMYRYHEFQLKLQALYESGNRKLSERICGHSIPKGEQPDTEYEFNKIRNDVAQAQV